MDQVIRISGIQSGRISGDGDDLDKIGFYVHTIRDGRLKINGGGYDHQLFLSDRTFFGER